MQITFLGGAGQVTGSQFLVKTDSAQFLLDCGLTQGSEARSEKNRRSFAFDPSALDFVILTHAHLDHCGLIPRLVGEGFHRPIYCTAATADLVGLVLPDSARIQEEDARFEQRRWRRGRLPEEPPGPLYTEEEAQASLELLTPVPYDEAAALTPALEMRLWDAGHLLGAATVELRCLPEGRRLVFSGDLGRSDRPILRDPQLPPPADIAVMESTYGSRNHETWDKTLNIFREKITATIQRGGHVIIPAFALGRTQDVLYCLAELRRRQEIPEVPVYVDSPMAMRATEIFRRHRECFDQEMRTLLAAGESPFEFAGLHYIHSTEQSRRLNEMAEPFVVVSASGMCSGGRIRHHLHHHLGHPQDELLFVGYQAKGTPGREILEGAGQITIFGQPHRVRCQISHLEGFSAHAGQRGLVGWAQQVAGRADKLFLVHGETESLHTLAGILGNKLTAEVYIAQEGETQEI